ncbi:hypothetical protein C2G38_2167732 [Gigaspora rosea]|uniref:Uncharacterized protein n=1 Tax=Gigaspora rosea TaxID=44941 RepID=A0A397VUT1_9GLOM|nr:hypothetical protein C2G38_2167732 [Gigaspora rosea]
MVVEKNLRQKSDSIEGVVRLGRDSIGESEGGIGDEWCLKRIGVRERKGGVRKGLLLGKGLLLDKCDGISEFLVNINIINS